MEKLSILLGKSVQKITRLRGNGGSALPGLVIERTNPKFVRKVLSKLPYGVVVVSGTNGKTTTTKIVTELLEAEGLKVFTNKTGSNFVRGVISAILKNIKLSGKFDYDIAVLELDEAHAVKFCEVVPINYALLLNVQRDQLDRFGEIDHTAELLQKVAENAQKAVVLNREDPRISKIQAKHQVYFGLSDMLLKKFPSDDNLLYKTSIVTSDKPAIVTLDKLDGQKATYRVKTEHYHTNLTLKGIYNAFNAAGALALVSTILPETDSQNFINTLSKVESAFGRGEVFNINDSEVEILLVKNPSAFQLSLASFVDDEHDYMIAINDNIADGRDISWLWNVDFKAMPGVKIVSGVRATDMALRLKYDEVKVDKIEENLETAVDKFTTANKKPKRIFATYTAMLEIRKIISGKSLL
jgi:UDP-N-acetylmuramyl tripeptide synthase